MEPSAPSRHSPVVAGRLGFTLPEVVMAIVVLGIALPPILFSLGKGARDAVYFEHHGIASALAQEKMEALVADRHSSNRGYPYLTNANYAAENPVSGFAGYLRSVSITEVAASDLSTASAGSGYKKVVVTVTYSNPTGSETLTCVLCNF